ncbi:IS3 family transposase [Paenibacillus turicensis]
MINQKEFRSLRHLEMELYDYINWFNKQRFHVDNANHQEKIFN